MTETELFTYKLHFELQEDISELPETLRILRLKREMVRLWRLKKSKQKRTE